MTQDQVHKEIELFNEWFSSLECENKPEPLRLLMQLAWLGAKEQAAEQGGWISVKESTPSLDDTVLLRDYQNNIRSGYLDGDAEAFVYTDSDSWIDDGVITHWQPLPAPPEKE